jgi:hypothetical protein
MIAASTATWVFILIPLTAAQDLKGDWPGVNRQLPGG